MNIHVKARSYTEHYYHFLYGYLIPFFNKFNPNDGNTYIFDSCGPILDKIILNLDGYNSEIFKNQIIDKVDWLPRHDTPEFENLNVEKTKNRIFSIVGEKPYSNENKILIINREDPHEFYLKEAKVKGCGSSRRSIPNIQEVFDVFFNYYGFNCEICSLEGMSLKQQILLFRDASCIIAQHGAAIGNIIWCRPQTVLIEIKHLQNKKQKNWQWQDCYEKLAKITKVKRILHLQKTLHSPVNSLEILKLVRKNTKYYI
jgi:hypothetical protein